MQTCRPADLQTCRLADLQTCRLADLQNCVCPRLPWLAMVGKVYLARARLDHSRRRLPAKLLGELGEVVLDVALVEELLTQLLLELGVLLDKLREMGGAGLGLLSPIPCHSFPSAPPCASHLIRASHLVPHPTPPGPALNRTCARASAFANIASKLGAASSAKKAAAEVLRRFR